jgi:hypothetical protein
MKYGLWTLKTFFTFAWNNFFEVSLSSWWVSYTFRHDWFYSFFIRLLFRISSFVTLTVCLWASGILLMMLLSLIWAFLSKTPTWHLVLSWQTTSWLWGCPDNMATQDGSPSQKRPWHEKVSSGGFFLFHGGPTLKKLPCTPENINLQKMSSDHPYHW